MAKEKLPPNFTLAGILSAKSLNIDLLRLREDVITAATLGDISTWVGPEMACSMLHTRVYQSGGYIDYDSLTRTFFVLINPLMAHFTRQQFNAMWFCFIIKYHKRRQGHLSLAFDFTESPSEPSKLARIDFSISTVLYELD